MGDMTREAYRGERERLEAELKGLQGATDRAGVLAQAAAFLRDLPAAWRAASPDQRNVLARTVFSFVEIADDRVVAVAPRTDFAPFFNLAEVRMAEAGNDEGQPTAAPGCQASTLAGGSDGSPFRVFYPPWRPRPGSLPRPASCRFTRSYPAMALLPAA